jgi:hypothetical protein
MYPFILILNVTDLTLGACGQWLETRAGAGSTPHKDEGFSGRNPGLHGQKVLYSFTYC